MMLYLVKWMQKLVYVTMFRVWKEKYNKNKGKFVKRLLVTIIHKVSVKFKTTLQELNRILKGKNGPASPWTHHMALQFQVSTYMIGMNVSLDFKEMSTLQKNKIGNS